MWLWLQSFVGLTVYTKPVLGLLPECSFCVSVVYIVCVCVCVRSYVCIQTWIFTFDFAYKNNNSGYVSSAESH